MRRVLQAKSLINDHPVAFRLVVDDLRLLLIHPAGERGEQALQRVGTVHGEVIGEPVAASHGP